MTAHSKPNRLAAAFIQNFARWALTALTILALLATGSAMSATLEPVPVESGGLTLVCMLFGIVMTGALMWTYGAFGTAERKSVFELRDAVLPGPTRPAPPMPVCKAPAPPAPLACEPPPETPQFNRRKSDKRADTQGVRISDLELPQVRPVGVVPPLQSHTDDVAVTLFTMDMRHRLAADRHLGIHGWHDTELITDGELAIALRLAMRRGDLVNIANHCMMLHRRGVRNVNTVK
jgi:hypothetical protein